MEVKVYSTPRCGYCHQAKQYLKEKGVPFTEYDVSVEQTAAQEMMKLTGQMGVPVIVVDGQAIIGFDRARLEVLINSGRSGNGKKPAFGLKVADASKMAQKAGAIPIFGAFVGEVKPGSAAEKAGLLPGDIVTEINLRTVNNAGDLEQALAALSIGGRVSIGFLRGQETLQTEVVV
jgi:glutaredoxin-like YruB-family protein